MDNNDIRRFLLQHRKIMPDVELAKLAGVSAQSVNQFINKSGGRTDGSKFQLNHIHRALGLHVETRVERTFQPEEHAWSEARPRPRTVEDWTLARPKPRRRSF